MARTEGQWKKGIGLITPSEDVPVLLRNSYLNFGGTTIGESGYGFRDNGGTMQFKNSGGSWAAFGGGGSGSGDVVGPASAVNEQIAVFDGATGKLIKDGGATIAAIRANTTNVTAAGALMDSEVTNLAQVKAFNSADYATAAQGATADTALQNIVEDTTPQLGGELDANGQNITGLSDVTFKTGATGGTIRTGISAADKFVLQAYDVDGAAYQKVLEADAGNNPQLEVFADSFGIWDTTDETKRLKFLLSGGTTGVTTTIAHSPTDNRTITFPDATATLATTTQVDAKPTISSGAGAPASTPTKVGDIYIDTTGDDAYIAVGTASSADWEKTNDGAGGGTGDVVGPASATDNAIARFDTATGKLIQNSLVTIDDSRDMVGLDSIEPNETTGFQLMTPGEKNIMAKFTYTGSDVNYPTFVAASTGENVGLLASGSDTNVGFYILTRGTGKNLFGNNVNPAILASNGNQDITIQTGNVTTGSITITNGANGAINIAPNGTGEAQVNGQRIIDESDTDYVKLAAVTATAAELNYTDGVTSNIQTQLGGKAATASPTLTGTTTIDRIDYDQGVGTVSALGNLGATETIDWATATHFTGNLDSNITFTNSNSVTGQSITLYLSFSTAQRTITWPSTTWLDNNDGSAPTAPAASGDVLVVTLQNIGGTIYGSATGNFAVYA